MKKKNTSFIPAYTVDITQCDTIYDVKLALALAKFNSKVALSVNDLETIINEALNAIRVCVIVDNIYCEEPKKKEPWYKRFWKKLKSIF